MKPRVRASRLRKGEWYVLKPEPYRGMIYAATWADAFQKALDWCKKQARRLERDKAGAQ